MGMFTGSSVQSFQWTYHYSFVTQHISAFALSYDALMCVCVTAMTARCRPIRVRLNELSSDLFQTTPVLASSSQYVRKYKVELIAWPNRSLQNLPQAINLHYKFSHQNSVEQTRVCRQRRRINNKIENYSGHHGIYGSLHDCRRKLVVKHLPLDKPIHWKTLSIVSSHATVSISLSPSSIHWLVATTHDETMKINAKSRTNHRGLS